MFSWMSWMPSLNVKSNDPRIMAESTASVLTGSRAPLPVRTLAVLGTSSHSRFQQPTAQRDDLRLGQLQPVAQKSLGRRKMLINPLIRCEQKLLRNPQAVAQI